MKGMGGPGIHSFHVGELILFKSDLKPTGALYTKLARSPSGIKGIERHFLLFDEARDIKGMKI